jgi:hypothetical protein
LVARLYANCASVTLGLLDMDAAGPLAMEAAAPPPSGASGGNTDDDDGSTAAGGVDVSSSRSLTLHAESIDREGQPEEPTVVRLGRARAMAIEAAHARRFGRVVDVLFVSVVRAPRFVNADGAETPPPVPSRGQGEEGIIYGGDEDEEDEAKEEEAAAVAADASGAAWGGLVLGLAGGLWQQPADPRQPAAVDRGGPAGAVDRRALSTFSQRLATGLAPDDREERSAELVVLSELWQIGGPLHTLAVKTAKRDGRTALAAGGWLARELSGLRRSMDLCQAARGHEAEGFAPPLSELVERLKALIEGGGSSSSDVAPSSSGEVGASAGSAWLRGWRPLLVEQYGSDRLASSLVLDARCGARGLELPRSPWRSWFSFTGGDDE